MKDYASSIHNTIKGDTVLFSMRSLKLISNSAVVNKWNTTLHGDQGNALPHTANACSYKCPPLLIQSPEKVHQTSPAMETEGLINQSTAFPMVGMHKLAH